MRIVSAFLLTAAVLSNLFITSHATEPSDIIIDDYYTGQKSSVTEDAAEVSNILPSILQLTLNCGEERELEVSVMPESAKDQPLTWRLATSYGAAAITPDGSRCTVRGVREGTEVLCIEAANGVASNVSITVRDVPVSKIVLDSRANSINLGESTLIRADVFPEDASEDNVIWSVTDGRENARVSYGGNLCKIVGIASGSVSVTASTPDGAVETALNIEIRDDNSAARAVHEYSLIIKFLVGGALVLLSSVMLWGAVRLARHGV